MPKNLANCITVCRIGLTPVFWWAWLTGRQPLATVLFAVGCFSDGLDGFIARRYRQETLLGQLLDPVADKLLLSGAFVIGTLRDTIPLWVTSLVVVRDVALIIGGVIFGLLWRGRISLQKFAPTWVGKASTMVEIAVISLLLLGDALRMPLQFWPNTEWPVVWFLLVGTGLVTIVSGVQYLVRALRLTLAHAQEKAL